MMFSFLVTKMKLSIGKGSEGRWNGPMLANINCNYLNSLSHPLSYKFMQRLSTFDATFTIKLHHRQAPKSLGDPVPSTLLPNLSAPRRTSS